MFIFFIKKYINYKYIDLKYSMNLLTNIKNSILQFEKNIIKNIRNISKYKEQIMIMMIVVLICWYIYLTYKIKHKEFFAGDTVVGNFAISSDNNTLKVPNLIIGSGNNKIEINPSATEQIKIFKGSNNPGKIKVDSTGKVTIDKFDPTVIGHYYKEVSLVDNTYTYIASLSFPKLGTSFILSVNGTDSGVVISTFFIVNITHGRDANITSYSCWYNRVNLKIIYNNWSKCAIYLTQNSGSVTICQVSLIMLNPKDTVDLSNPPSISSMSGWQKIIHKAYNGKRETSHTDAFTTGTGDTRYVR